MAEIALIMPVYHSTAPFVAEHLRRYRQYLQADFRLIVVDDHTTDGTYDELQKIARESPEMILLRNPKNYGWGMGVYYSTVWGLRVALEHGVRWAVRLDHDSLLLGPGLVEEVDQVFAADPTIGLLGTVRASPKVWYMFHMRMNRAIQRAARENGYLEVMDGLVWTACSGGIVLRRELLESWNQRGWLVKAPMRQFFTTKELVDDTLYGIYTYAAGFKVLDLPSFRIFYKSNFLDPYPPALLGKMGVKLIHPVKPRASNYRLYEVGALDHLKRFDKVDF